MGNQYRKIDKKTKDQFMSMRKVTSILEGFRTNYWLAAGTLLSDIQTDFIK